MGVDSTSHLYKVIFMVKSFRENGYIPFWTPDWYGGTPLLLLYPPLTYYLCFILSLGGLDPVSSYKIVEAIFYIMAPYSIYILSRELGLAETEGWTAALLLSLSPAIIDNMLFYDRLPTVLSIPLLCLYLTYFHRSYRDKFHMRSWIASTILLASLILTHHLSALIAVLISITAISSSLPALKKTIRGFGSLASTCAASLGLSSLWLIPFLYASKVVADNPFYNRNVMDLSFGKLSFLIRESIVNFGPLHFTLAMTMLGILAHKTVKNGKYLSLGFASIFLSGLALFELGVKNNLPTLKMASQTIIVLLFASSTIGSIILMRKLKHQSYSFLSLWFLIFLWFGLGGFMVPFVSNMSPPFIELPLIPYIWSKLDVHRFWLYLSIPGSLLAAPILLKALKKAKFNHKYTWVASSLLLILAIGGFIKAAWTLTHPINKYLPRDYTIANQEIPEGIIQYLSSDPWNGRILAVHCPFWIYLLP
ncbi:MAG: 6-pyruvoyl-tetrahydropterin synthase-related protein [Candidatus Bathyarchaeia archaeon]